MCVETYIKTWLDYVEHGTSSEELRDIESRIGSLPLRVALIKVFIWLKSRARTGSPRLSLSVNSQHDWVKNLRIILDHAETAHELFNLTESKLDFSVSLDEEVRDSLLRLVDNCFNPPLMR